MVPCPLQKGGEKVPCLTHCPMLLPLCSFLQHLLYRAALANPVHVRPGSGIESVQQLVKIMLCWPTAFPEPISLPIRALGVVPAVEHDRHPTVALASTNPLLSEPSRTGLM